MSHASKIREASEDVETSLSLAGQSVKNGFTELNAHLAFSRKAIQECSDPVLAKEIASALNLSTLETIAASFSECALFINQAAEKMETFSAVVTQAIKAIEDKI